MTRRLFWISRSLVLLITLSTLVFGSTSQSRAADIEGTTWTSPNYGVEVTWDDTWFVMDEGIGEVDSVTLTNGLSVASFNALPDPVLSPEAALAGWIPSVATDPAVSDFTPLVDESGNVFRGTEGGRAYAAFSYVYTYPDGQKQDEAVYIEAWLIDPGVSSVGFLGFTPLRAFWSELPLMRELTGFPGPIPIPVPPGEDAPVFGTGPWRVAIVSSVLNEEIAAAGLKQRSGKEWLVVIADVTNWSDANAELALRDFRLRVDGANKPLKVAPSSALTVAERLGLTVPNKDLVLSIAAGETIRVALVYLMPEGGRAPELLAGKFALPLADTLDSTLELEQLPEVTGPPELEQGTVVSASDGRTMRVMIEGESESVRIQLLGVEPPGKESCHRNDAEDLLDSLVGTTVLVEVDAALNVSETPSRYVWTPVFDGSRTLLNQQLIAEGRAMSDTLPGDARFGLWLDVTETSAKAAGAGLWEECEATSDASASDTDKRPPPRQNTPTPTSIWVD